MNEMIQHLHESNAQQYYDAYQRCLKGNGDGVYLTIPAITCAAFSAELGIKAILNREGLKTRGHKLKELLERLPAEDRDKIISLTSASYLDFNNQLEAASNAFVEWRYMHEQENEIQVNVFFIGNFAESILKVLSAKT